jgi:hypothetical protein
MENKCPPGYLTEDGAADLAEVSTRTIRRRVAAGELAAYAGPDRRRRYFLRDDVLALTEPRPLDHDQ